MTFTTNYHYMEQQEKMAVSLKWGNFNTYFQIDREKEENFVDFCKRCVELVKSDCKDYYGPAIKFLNENITVSV